MFDIRPSLRCAGRRLYLDQPQVMGVLNVTPDSFSDGGLHLDPAAPAAEAGSAIAITFRCGSGHLFGLRLRTTYETQVKTLSASSASPKTLWPASSRFSGNRTSRSKSSRTHWPPSPNASARCKSA